MIFSGVVALLLSGTFLVELIGGSGVDQASDSFPIVLEIRSFRFVDIFLEDSSALVRSIMRLLFLPINYLFELGFFMIVGIVWWKSHNRNLDKNPFYRIELLLFLVSFFLATFTRSTLIVNNDLGWRAWLPGQFILLIWGVDVISQIYSESAFTISLRTKAVLLVLALLGISTTLLDGTLLRFAYYFSYGSETGHRIYSARQAYTFINDTLPEDVIVQYNPSNSINRPSGLYGMRQSAISDRTAYGIPNDVYLAKVDAVSEIFDLNNLLNWNQVDKLCEQHFIDILVITDADKLWIDLPLLSQERTPLYKDDYYAVFVCGAYSASP